MAWNKPVGVSHVYMMLIGCGGSGDGASGGGSGAITVWYGAAQHVPSSLVIAPAAIQGDATIIFFRNTASLRTLLRAECGIGPNAGITTAAGPFAASGFYRSTAGQNGVNGAQSASTTTFLSGGSGGVTTGNYGYVVSDNRTGFFQMQPIIVGVGSSASNSGTAGIGCGGGYDTPGGPGMVLIASW